MGLWSFGSFSLLSFVLLYPFHPKFGAQAEISSPAADNRFHRRELTLLEPRITGKPTEAKVSSKVDYGTKVLPAFGTESVGVGALNPGEAKRVGKETLSGLGNEAPISINTEPNRLQISGKKYGYISGDNQKLQTANIKATNSFLDTKKVVKRSVGTTYTDTMDKSISGESQSREMFGETVQGVSNYRAEYRRAGEEAKGSNPRQSEPHLDTSTFALSGDSAHNQAMVHWSGHNSSVSFSVAKTLHHIASKYTLSRLQMIYACLERRCEHCFLRENATVLRTSLSARTRGCFPGKFIISVQHSVELSNPYYFFLFTIAFSVRLYGHVLTVCALRGCLQTRALDTTVHFQTTVQLKHTRYANQTLINIYPVGMLTAITIHQSFLNDGATCLRSSCYN